MTERSGAILPSKLRGPPCLSSLLRELVGPGRRGWADLCCHARARAHSGSVESSQLSRQGPLLSSLWADHIISTIILDIFDVLDILDIFQCFTRNTFYGLNMLIKRCFSQPALVPSVFAEKNDILWAFFSVD